MLYVGDKYFPDVCLPVTIAQPGPTYHQNGYCSIYYPDDNSLSGYYCQRTDHISYSGLHFAVCLENIVAIWTDNTYLTACEIYRYFRILYPNAPTHEEIMKQQAQNQRSS